MEEFIILTPEEVQKFSEDYAKLIELTKLSDVESAMFGSGGSKYTEQREELMVDLLTFAARIIVHKEHPLDDETVS
jgi:hypothetical protein